MLTTKVDDDGILTYVHNLVVRVKALQNHIVDYNLVHVFTIVVPQDISQTVSVDPDSNSLLA